MLTNDIVHFREADLQEDALIARHFYQLWLDNDVAPVLIKPDWLPMTLQFIANARQQLHYKAFVVEVNGRITGSTSCQLYAGPYPLILSEAHRKYGYIWGVYVEPEYRGRGFASQLTTLAVDYLKSLDCTRAILNASPSGRSVYQGLGFLDSNEMRLDLK